MTQPRFNGLSASFLFLTGVALCAPVAAAPSKCDCAAATLIGDSVTAQHGTQPPRTVTTWDSANPSDPATFEMHKTDFSLRPAPIGMKPAFSIDIRRNQIFVLFESDFTVVPAGLTFDSLDPTLPGCQGTPEIVGATLSPHGAPPFASPDLLTFSPHQVKVRLGPNGTEGTARTFPPGSGLVIDLKFACAKGGRGK